MKIARFASFGIPHEVTECVEVDDVEAPLGDEAVVEVEAFPINPVDLLTIAGDYATKPALPAIPGSEGVGCITHVGSEVSSVAPGDRVILLGRDNWVQQRKVKYHQVLKVPHGVDVLQLAMLKINPATAWLMLHNYETLADGDWLIQDAANSGVGHNVIQLAKTKGIRTVNVVRRDAPIASLQSLGADVVLLDGDDLPERVKSATNNAEIRLAIDAVAGGSCMRLADCLAEGATMVNYGLLSGKPCMLRGDQTIFRGITLTGFWLVKALSSMSVDDIAALYERLAGHIADGTLYVNVEKAYPIEDIKTALAHAERSGRRGKILVMPNHPPPV